MNNILFNKWALEVATQEYKTDSFKLFEILRNNEVLLNGID